jgi:type II secretory ATPase GspE/PulE/Tfp pilus assembly ATPase PilB-like protein
MDAAQVSLLFNSLSTQDRQALPPHALAQAAPYQAVGCPSCDKGYKGRIGLYQIMPISEAMQTLAAQAAQEGVRTLRQAGWLKVLQGITSIEEVTALTHHV